MTPDTIQSLLIEVAYSIRQLRQYGDVQRALDSLERAECALRCMAAWHELDVCGADDDDLIALMVAGVRLSDDQIARLRLSDDLIGGLSNEE